MSNINAPLAPSFSALVQHFFADYLLAQRAMSSNTVASYRDAMLLFLDFAHERLGKMPTELCLADLDPDLILAFLDHLEQKRSNSVRSRNLRLTALRAFLKFAGRRDVASLLTVERALGVPMKRFDRPMLGFLSREEMLAVIGQPGPTWTSQRDYLLLTMLYNTGARVSEIVAVQISDVVLNTSTCVHLHGKGRKQRSVPLWKSTVQDIRTWQRRNPQLLANSPLLPNRDGRAMTRNNVNQRLAIAVASAAQTYPSLAKRSVSPHTIRHSTAMHMLQSGVTFSVIALWMGHESTTTTHRYVEADLTMKEKELARLDEPEAGVPHYRPPDKLRAFLEAL
ncbi:MULTISPECIES: tyrosine-type recombinase/integrase [Thiorhodovibrio]|uniref:tyrosine-type recombinase/integrase n=1 Tax=Thiorhodovibrio TaxID=61593 RepID=UPI001911BFEA|nr:MULTISPECIES: tyrosine-type recombinase/integrase [Thiorhodovibrio]MBK5969772.1 integrase [Thiorhodovibrio winogradskyi]WPL12243.1 Tyrosine recombinase XerD [Thiorhodovibrio litoralis]